MGGIPPPSRGIVGNVEDVEAAIGNNRITQSKTTVRSCGNKTSVYDLVFLERYL